MHITYNIPNKENPQELTVFKSNTLTTCRQVKRFSNRHFCNMPILLTDIRRCSLRNKLLKTMAIVRDFS
ncbi:hypothetical protein HanIR_Chr10g0499851 [Helianthus annuus]|nr:hypothetical protein HanIR_Chr10g0499851 [Helianthus annuus]